MLDPETFARRAADVLSLYPGPAVEDVPYEDKDSFAVPLRKLAYTSDIADEREPPLDEMRSCFSRFAADYLPSFIRLLTSYLCPERKLSKGMVRLFCWLLDTIVYAGPVVFRYTREHVDDVRRLFLVSVRCFGAIDRHRHLCPDLNMELPYLALVAYTLNQLLENMIACSVQERHFLPGLKLRPRAGLTASQTFDLVRARAGLISDGLLWPYWVCETARPAGAEKNVCSRLPAGEEMSVCSQCLAVRYCSRAHQKADWKRHKLECFKPTW